MINYFNKLFKEKITVKKNTLADNICVCNLVRRGEITSGFCSKHNTDWV